MNIRLLFGIVIFITEYVGYANTKLGSKKTDVEFLELQRKLLQEKGVRCSLKVLSARSLAHFRLTSNNVQSTVSCVLEGMKDKELQASDFMWSTLGTLFFNLGQTSQAAACFKQASKLSGKVTAFVKEWSFIGPFVIGKIEVDGDPTEAFGGIRNVSKTRFKKNAGLFSELLPGGEIKWSHLQQISEDKAVQVRPSVNWNDLVSSLGSMGITEWQGWLVGEFAVNDNGLDIVIQCFGIHTVYIDDIPVTGDVYHRDKYWYGVRLDQGLHTIYIKIRSKVNAQFLCKLKVAKTSFQALSPNFLPDLLDGHLFSRYLSFPVANYHSSEFLRISKVVLTDLQSKSEDLLAKIDVQLEGSSISIAPGQIYPVIIKLKVKDRGVKVINRCSEPESPWDVEFNIKVTTNAGSTVVPVLLRCRTGTQSFLFTFIDHDGSLQQAAAIQPLQDCEGGACPVVMSLHGTTISPQNQADSYKHMVNGQFVFGFPRAWTLAPTRHGAHNWEGPGLQTALTALDMLAEMTETADWISNKADGDHVIYAGHSMGGHGAWHIATHYPDRALGVVSVAGWIKKEEYGDSNLFFRHDIATSHVEPAVKSVLEACIVENDADQHVSNLHGIPVLIRIGAADRTVHPWFQRRMYRLLKEEGMTVNYTEVKDKEHWWWDSVDTNDGGAVNDQYLRDFTNAQIDHYLENRGTSQGSCDTGECGGETAGDRYRDTTLTFTLTCYNPALGTGMYGIRILQQFIPHRKSVIQVTMTADTVTMTTRNVLRFSLSSSHSRNVNWSHVDLKVDRTEIHMEDKADICYKAGVWSVCDDESVHRLTNRGPFTYGPARQIAERPLKVVIGSIGSAESQQYLQLAAVYIANLFFLTSDSKVDIVQDVNLPQEHIDTFNLIILGNTEENTLTERFLRNIPVRISPDGISLGGCDLKEPRIGLLTLAPNGADHLALVLLGLSKQGLADVVSLASPTIPPMTRSPFSNLIPDYVVTGPRFGRKGPGGYLCTGFYGNQWEYQPETSSCV